MPNFLTHRDTESTELMDNPDCDTAALINTYQQFEKVNTLISGWRQIYKTWLKPLFKNRSQSYSLLDIGFGGGDIPLNIAKWSARDGIDLKITAIETDKRAINFVQTLHSPANIDFKHCSSTEVFNRGQQFDVVISNHLIHHLSTEEFQRLLVESKKLSNKLVLFNDIERSAIGYLLFNFLSRPFFRSSFITHDGLTSIKRSYTLKEMREQAPDDWDVQRFFPFRLLLSYRHE